tara:strand:+ start:12 stop:371 length:360 start_codon:yes stop_codon:yes gene_type:complete
MPKLRRTYREGGNQPLTNKEFRQNERYRSRAERDAAIAMRGADDVEGLMENLDDYYNLKDRDIAGKAMGTMGTMGLLAKLAYELEQRRRRAARGQAIDGTARGGPGGQLFQILFGGEPG